MTASVRLRGDEPRGAVVLLTSRVVPGRTDEVVIVGAGLGGLSAALRLVGAGRRVTVVEQSAVPGGRAGV
ncbi:MAG: NAD(P)-binding protein, partial [Jatrophihabitantaceae bacterium]